MPPIQPVESMKHARFAVFKSLRLIALACVCLCQAAHADDYTDVSQLLRASKFAEAMTRVDAYLSTKPADPQMRFLKGVIQRNLGKQAEAITTFTKLTEDYPELPEPYNNLAVLYAGQGLYDKARAALEMAIRTNPSYATAHENIGDVYARLASQAYNKALQLDSGNTAVPPKLALIRELFKPNLANAKSAASAPVAATPAPAPAPAPTPVPVPVTPPPATPVAPPVVAKPPPAVVAPVAVVPAVKPAAPVASMASVAAKPAPAPVPHDADAVKAAETAVLAWARAWEGRDMTAYLKAYSPQFTPSGKVSRSAWEKDRRDRILGKSSISVKLTDLKIEVNGDKAVARFRQAYRADALAVSSHKTLDLHKVNNHWLITRESTGG